ncbi:unnamed protein product [Ostreobium quekettii]|uniref:Survival of motor neuron-related-splicing factor 30 n=1 Tax=Ostreobium quekettii TaxID=121088 RepID=A0A8S1JDB1_9CHLO|nr:unnamed protein product [Ostreobium quekettii]|eukprot:evm.model.scf_137.9 EVM.evm.TU.scf_137.9   scf_137:79278-83773(+)
MAEFSSVEEMRASLDEYKEQLQQVDLLLGEFPDNEDYQEAKTTLTEAIQLVEGLLIDGGSFGDPSAAAGVSEVPSTSGHFDAGQQQAPSVKLPSTLPASVAEQIRRAQVKAALLGQAPPAWAVGAECQAVYSGDGQWYDAAIQSVTAGGEFVVVFEGYGNSEEVDPKQVRPRPDIQEVYKGVAAPKRKRVEDEPVISEIPKWCEMKDTDDDKTKSRKKKLLKSYKSKIRFQQMDLDQKKKQQDWHSFVQGKGSKKKAGVFTGRKKTSIFSVPEEVGGKVGVVGSGKGMTDYQKRARHEFAPEEL